MANRYFAMANIALFVAKIPWDFNALVLYNTIMMVHVVSYRTCHAEVAHFAMLHNTYSLSSLRAPSPWSSDWKAVASRLCVGSAKVVNGISGAAVLKFGGAIVVLPHNVESSVKGLHAPSAFGFRRYS